MCLLMSVEKACMSKEDKRRKRVKESVCVCVCVCEREREREWYKIITKESCNDLCNFPLSASKFKKRNRRREFVDRVTC